VKPKHSAAHSATQSYTILHFKSATSDNHVWHRSSSQPMNFAVSSFKSAHLYFTNHSETLGNWDRSIDRLVAWTLTRNVYQVVCKKTSTRHWPWWQDAVGRIPGSYVFITWRKRFHENSFAATKSMAALRKLTLLFHSCSLVLCTTTTQRVSDTSWGYPENNLCYGVWLQTN